MVTRPGCTPSYIALEETKRDKMRIIAAKLAIYFEEKVRRGKILSKKGL